MRSSDGLVMIYRTPGPGSGFTYGLAMSADGLNWVKYHANPILERDDLPDVTGLFFPTFAYADGTYYFYIEAFEGVSKIFLLTSESPLMVDEIVGKGAAVNTTHEVTVSTLVAELPSATGGLTVDASGTIYAANIGQKPSRNGR